MESVISWIGSVMDPVMGWIYGLCGSFGVTVLLFTLLSKIVLLPLGVWVHKNGIKVIRMQPAVNRLKAEHYGDKDAIADGQAALYKQEKYSPLASLVPLVFQILILMGVMAVIRNPSFAVRDMHFLGLDLSGAASARGGVYLLCPVLAGLSSFILSVAQNRMNPLQKEQGTGMQWGTLVFSVGISLVLGYFVPAGVALYWIASNLLAIGQQALLNKVIPPEKHIDYEALRESREELAKLESLDAGVSRSEARALARREKECEKRFTSTAGKHLVFYSESQGFYKYFEPVIQEILARSNLTVHYITSDPSDRIFELSRENERIQAYYIGPKRLITVFMKMDADVVVMTMSDLENYHYKRSYIRKDIRYIYMFHYPLSTHMVLHTGALDHYDEILCVGDFQVPEIRKAETLNGLPQKILKVCGYCQLDTLYKAYLKKENRPNEKPKVLIAPSWQDSNILDSCIDGMLEAMLGQGWQVTVRPHPEYVKRYKPRMDAIVRRWEEKRCSDLVFETDFTSNESIFASDVVITDWSGTATEFAFVTLRPCIFVDTPMKVNNPDYVKLGIEPQEIRLRDRIGVRVDPNHPEQAAERIRALLSDASGWRERIEKIRSELIANFPDSAPVSAKEILRAVVEQQYAEAGKEVDSRE